MTIRSLLRDLMPPLLMRRLRTLRGLDRSYPTWADALVAAGSYEDQDLSRFRIDRAAINGDLKSDVAQNPVFLLCSLIGGRLEVVDCGGSTGPNGRALIEAYPEVSYTVMENPTLVSMMPKGEAVRFTDRLPDAFDIFYAGGTLQYFEDPITLMAMAFKSARKAVVLSRTSFSTRNVIYIQRAPLFFNGGGKVPPGYKDRMISYPHRAIREADIQNLAKDAGFVLASRTPEAVAPNAIFDRDLYGAQLIFLRIPLR